MGDVHVVLAEDRSQETDQARGVDVVIQKQIAVEIRIQVEVAKFHEPQELIAEDRAGGGELPRRLD